ncbi:hypothetical protein SAMN05421788_101669 [Filimonas lacunae]|uniref:Urease accessory protein UreH-like transmembrane domain-containing protein n=1 Tax=Filimonas lacunae TaxID=477680 RepID=A0A173MP35_9BACT|nr:sulfite exporter TauE/SafE family protein [Filimonas lacunae]BAV09229.1 heavy-metal-associated domain (N-terminus) and membrane-bounded cytochrome biogenesis cycZ-like domain, possible membrane copper tolerance protein [Filimonas lacunae]SIS69378.1 hypothetical protein SAMN05421788_101669 [Filimonas lacunae]
MWWAIVIPGFLLGCVSSLHCVGMCGPLVLALPLNNTHSPKWIGLLLYHAGRTTSYALLGAIAGIAGRRVFVPAWQHWLAVLAGSLIILTVLAGGLQRVRKPNFLFRKMNKAILALTQYCMRQKRIGAFYLLGMGNGFLPCGLVFIAVTTAFVSNSFTGGILFMIMYGLGTSPLLLSLSLLGFAVGMPLRNAFKKITPVLTIMAGVLLLLKGFNVSIPIISYWLPEHKEAVGCQPLN